MSPINTTFCNIHSLLSNTPWCYISCNRHIRFRYTYDIYTCYSARHFNYYEIQKQANRQIDQQKDRNMDRWVSSHLVEVIQWMTENNCIIIFFFFHICLLYCMDNTLKTSKVISMTLRITFHLASFLYFQFIHYICQN